MSGGEGEERCRTDGDVYLCVSNTQRATTPVRTNIEIDDELMKRAMDLMGLKTKRETVEEALRTIVRQREAHEALMKLYGKVKWEGDLDEMRRDSPRVPLHK